MNKEQLYGGLIFIVSSVIAVIYVAAFFAKMISAVFPAWPPWLDWWAVGLPPFLLTLLALVFVMWIGWVMLTTPPPLLLKASRQSQAANRLESQRGNMKSDSSR